ncbi:MAG: hypothetical protein ACK5MK_03860 [Dysgonomonas sp.]
MEIWIIIIIVVTVIYYFNKQKPQSQTKNSDVNDWVETYDKEELLNVLKNISGFTPSKIIESKQAFYVFGLDAVSRKIAFVTNDLATLIIKFEDIVSNKISQTNSPNNVISYSSRIYLDIQRKHFNTSALRIECFNGDKLANRFIAPIKNPLMQQAIYNEELRLATEINNIIDQIKNKNTENTPPPPPRQTIVPPRSAVSEKTVIKPETKADVQSKKIEVIDPNIFQAISANKKPDETENSIKPEDIEPVILDNRIPEPENELVEGKTKVRIEDIEKQSRGIFFDHELVSIINDARVKGLTEVYISDEKIKSLREQEATNLENNPLTSQPDIVYKPIDYQTSYQEKDINSPLQSE